MNAHTVTYTDPPWLVADGRFDAGRATVEHEVLGGDVDLRFGPHADGRYRIDCPELLERVAGSEILVVYRCQVTPELLDAAGDQLRGIVRQGVGIDNLNVPLLTERGLFGYHVPDYCVDEVAAHTASLGLALERRLIPQHQTLKSGSFAIYAGGTPNRISRRTLGIVGFGRIGRAVAAKLSAFYGQVLVYDPHVGRDLPEGYRAKAVDTLAELLQRSHTVTLHCPLNQETEQMIGADQLRLMRPDAYLLNAARGKLIDPVALGKALNEGWIAGAGLDVFFPENPHDDSRWQPVLEHPATVVTSHRAFLSEDAEASSRRRVAELVRDRLAGRTPTVGLLCDEAVRK
ncbi:dehydrogenase [Longimycelium tulufanense]|uniref:Dehydrogenase n=1 Tax=Longimycelium tulufanense TaxID=907463 RepID=A0A8J3C9X9_9PSEU|nr:C-terminal binding protein [Longimycelium tulufanense]GGM41536.1 dehydrogenase [Longimycelium tulufanense]